MKKSRIFVVSILVLLLVLNNTMFSFVGWYKDGDKMTYVNNSGYRIANAWRESDGMLFYLDETGYVLYNKCFEYSGKIYCVGRNGARITDAFVDVTPDMIVGDTISPGIFYFTSNGTAFQKNSTNFTKNIDGKKYAFDDEGHLMADCWLTSDGDIVDSSSDTIKEGCYYVKSDGVLMQNEWYNFTNDSASDYTLDRSNLIAADYFDMNSLWMYFGNNCKKTVGGTTTKNVTINGKEYAFDENGIMLMGFKKNQGEVDTNQASNPVVSEKIRFYDKYSGELVKNRWISDITPESFSESDFLDGKIDWYYVDSDGAIVKNKVATVDGKKYIFDGFGRLRNGFILIDGISYFVAEYKSEDLSRDDFIYKVSDGGKLYGSELSDIYYFDENEKNEGVMRTGTVNIELSDGVYEFDFKPSGKAVGNRNELKLDKNTYYINSLKLKPWEDTRYGIVKVSDEEYRVINTSGKIVTGRKRVIKDDYDNYMIILNDKLAGYILAPNRKGTVRWKTIDGITGYYFYDQDSDPKRYTHLLVESGVSCPTATQIADIPNDLKVNFK